MPTGPIPRLRTFPVFSSTSFALLKMKPVRARGWRNKFQHRNLQDVLSRGKTKPQIRLSEPYGFLPTFLGGGVVDFMESGTISGAHRCSVHGAKAHGCWQWHTVTYTQSHVCEHGASRRAAHRQRLYLPSELLCEAGVIMSHSKWRHSCSESLSGLLKDTQQSEDSCDCVYVNTVYILD